MKKNIIIITFCLCSIFGFSQPHLTLDCEVGCDNVGGGNIADMVIDIQRGIAGSGDIVITGQNGALNGTRNLNGLFDFEDLNDVVAPTTANTFWGWNGTSYGWFEITGTTGGSDGVITDLTVTGTTTKTATITRSVGNNITETWTDLVLTEAQVDAYVSDNGFITAESDGIVGNEYVIDFSYNAGLITLADGGGLKTINLSNIPLSIFDNDLGGDNMGTGFIIQENFGYSVQIDNDGVSNPVVRFDDDDFQLSSFDGGHGVFIEATPDWAKVSNKPAISVNSPTSTVSGTLNLASGTLTLDATSGGSGGTGNVTDMITGVSPSGSSLVFTGQNGAFNGSVNLNNLSLDWSVLNNATVPNGLADGDDLGMVSWTLNGDVGSQAVNEGKIVTLNTVDEYLVTNVTASGGNVFSNIDFNEVGILNYVKANITDEHFLNTDLTGSSSRNHVLSTGNFDLILNSGSFEVQASSANNTGTFYTGGARTWMTHNNSRVNLENSKAEVYYSNSSGFVDIILTHVNGTGNIRPRGIPAYNSHSAADADVNLASESLYKLTNDRNIYAKP